MDIEVHGRKDMEEYLKNNKLEYLQQAAKPSVNRIMSIEEKENIRTLLKTINRTGTTLLDNGEGTMYLLDHADREDIEKRNPKKEDGFNCRLKFSTEGLNDEFINKTKKEIENGIIRDQKTVNRRIKDCLKRQGSHDSNSIDAEVRASNADNVRLDSKAQLGESLGRPGNQNSPEDFGTGFIRVYENDGTNGPRYIPINQDATDLSFFIGKNARTKFEESLRKQRPDMSDTEIESTLDFLHSLEDNKENTAFIKTAVRWVANRSITLPQDNTKARQAFDLARKKHIDLQKYSTLGELITAPEMQPKEKEKQAFNPDTAKTFSNKQTVTTKGGRIFTVYDVENTGEGQREVCKALAAHYEMSPWCLSTFTSKGEPTESAKYYWNLYSTIPRKIAFENGKPVAFSSSKYKKKPTDTFRGIPITKVGESAAIINIKSIPHDRYDSWIEDGSIKPSKTDPDSAILTPLGEKEIFPATRDLWWDMFDAEGRIYLDDNTTKVSHPQIRSG